MLHTRFYVKTIIFVLLIVGLVLWAFHILDNPLNFPIKEVQIQATYQHLNPDTLRQEVAPYLAESFFGLNTRQIKKQIMQQPWVNSIAINRIWPNKIIIKIAEQNAVAKWNGNALLNDNAEVFMPPVSTFPAGLPLLLGPANRAKEVWSFYQQMVPAIAVLGVKIAQLNLDTHGEWKLLLDNGIDVYLGNVDVMQRFTRFVSAYPKIIGARADQVAKIDMRYNNGFAVKWENANLEQQ